MQTVIDFRCKAMNDRSLRVLAGYEREPPMNQDFCGLKQQLLRIVCQERVVSRVAQRNLINKYEGQ